jgi:hypothetical protein
MRTLIEVPLDRLVANPYRNLPENPVDEAQVAALKDSMRDSEFWAGITVRPHPEQSGCYQLVFGHRRVEAAQRLLGRTAPVPVICDDSLTDAQVLKMAARENGNYCTYAPAFCVEMVRGAKTFLPATETTPETWITDFLGWPLERVRTSLALLAALEAGTLDWEALVKCPHMGAAKTLLQRVKTAAAEGTPVPAAIQQQAAAAASAQMAAGESAQGAVDAALRESAREAMTEKDAPAPTLDAPAPPAHDPLMAGEVIPPSPPKTPAALEKDVTALAHKLARRFQTDTQDLGRLATLSHMLQDEVRFNRAVAATRLCPRAEHFYRELSEMLPQLQAVMASPIPAAVDHTEAARKTKAEKLAQDKADRQEKDAALIQQQRKADAQAKAQKVAGKGKKVAGKVKKAAKLTILPATQADLPVASGPAPTPPAVALKTKRRTQPSDAAILNYMTTHAHVSLAAFAKYFKIACERAQPLYERARADFGITNVFPDGTPVRLIGAEPPATGAAEPAEPVTVEEDPLLEQARQLLTDDPTLSLPTLLGLLDAHSMGHARAERLYAQAKTAHVGVLEEQPEEAEVLD